MEEARLWGILIILQSDGLRRVGEQICDRGRGAPDQLLSGQSLLRVIKRAPQNLKQVAARRRMQIRDITRVELGYGQHRDWLANPAILAYQAFDDSVLFRCKGIGTEPRRPLAGGVRYVFE